MPFEACLVLTNLAHFEAMKSAQLVSTGYQLVIKHGYWKSPFVFPENTNGWWFSIIYCTCLITEVQEDLVHSNLTRNFDTSPASDWESEPDPAECGHDRISSKQQPAVFPRITHETSKHSRHKSKHPNRLELRNRKPLEFKKSLLQTVTKNSWVSPTKAIEALDFGPQFITLQWFTFICYIYIQRYNTLLFVSASQQFCLK